MERKEAALCPCSGTTETQIKDLLAAGVDNLERLSRITGACSGCGACESDIEQLLAEHAASDKAHATVTDA